jgi:hypothetical protein
MTGPRSIGGKAGPRPRSPASLRCCATRSTGAVALICERGKVGRRCLGSAAFPDTGRLAAISVVADSIRAEHDTKPQAWGQDTAAAGVGLEPTSPRGQRFSSPRTRISRCPSSTLTILPRAASQEVTPSSSRLVLPRSRKGMAGEWQNCPSIPQPEGTPTSNSSSR